MTAISEQDSYKNCSDEEKHQIYEKAKKLFGEEERLIPETKREADAMKWITSQFSKLENRFTKMVQDYFNSERKYNYQK